jgi:tetratricopeptide (TPR) repeat protein
VKKIFVHLFLIALAAFAVYAVSLPADFRSMDDQQTIVENADIRSFANLGKIFSSSFFEMGAYYRPLVVLSNMINYHFAGADPFAFNLTNLLLHILTALSVYGMLQLLFQDRLLSFFTALLFAVHPVHWSAVTNVAGRAIILCSLFFINSFSLFILSLKEERPRRRVLWCMLSLSAFALAMFSKESGIVLPAVLAVYVLITHQQKQQRRSLLLRTAPFAVLAGGYLFLRALLGIRHFFNWGSLQGLLVGITTFLQALITYLRLLVMPVDLHFDRSIPYISFLGPVFIAVLVFWLLAAVFLWKQRARLSAESKFLLAWFAVGLLPVSQIVPIVANSGYATTAEHFLYLPSVGILVLLVMGARRGIGMLRDKQRLSRRGAVLAAAGFYAFLMLITLSQAVYSTNELAMFERSLRYNPHNIRVRTSLALAFSKRGLFKEAEEHFRRALSDEEIYVNARIGLGKALFDQGKYFEGLAEYERVIREWGPLPLAKRNLEASHAILIDKFQEKIRGDPNNARLHYTLGVILSRAGHIEDSVGEYRTAVRLEPDFKNALFNLAASYTALGDPDGAIGSYERMLALSGPADVLDYQANLQLGRLYEQKGDPEKSRHYLREGESMPPESKEFLESYVAEVKE